MTYASSSFGTQSAFDSLSRGVVRKRAAKAKLYAAGGGVEAANLLSRSLNTFTEEDREQQKESGA